MLHIIYRPGSFRKCIGKPTGFISIQNSKIFKAK